ncbi:MAG TPA: DUF1836 domain-containing protein [Bacillus sp. (in: firmicutes)]|uniref:DUF1836 domain-containing protein n=1 Tax=Bacillus litorisediminis TaxID=2922713 RepID=UPI001FAB4250|nr:DUF1836 domain-containing protein [Bacillus litorisediminis]HWO77114.1 DUF1836 domain-containing protein [Bacillus sp. (in: firmicutes)]
MENMKKIIKDLHLDNHIAADDIPTIDLYMDQVIQLFETHFESSKRNEDEKVLTKTMINNYAKGKLFFPIKNKKYSREHILLISLIYQLKGALSINDIKTTLELMNHKIVHENFDLAKVYNSYLYLTKQNSKRFESSVEDSLHEVVKEVESLGDSDSDYLKQFLLIASFVNLSNFYRRAAEKLVDQIKISK